MGVLIRIQYIHLTVEKKSRVVEEIIIMRHHWQTTLPSGCADSNIG